MDDVDLGAIPVVDEHCHGLVPLPERDLAAWRACFTESRDEAMRRTHVASSLSYRRLLAALASLLECEPDEEAVLDARARYGPRLPERLATDARIETLVIDRGYPTGETLPDELWGSATRALSLLRLEPLMERLVQAHASPAALREAMAVALEDVRGQGCVGLKSIAAYRSGLEVRAWDEEDLARSLAAARRGAGPGRYRIQEKPLLDSLLLVALEQASRQGLPVQFHVGYGDVDADLRLANPLHLRWVLHQPRFRGAPLVLLHHCYPYTREGAYLAAVHEQVHLDLSFGIPFLGLAELEASTRAALAVAPTSKLLYSSDGVGVPELHWLGARDGRRALGRALGGCVGAGELQAREAEAIGEAILRGNARRLYGLR